MTARARPLLRCLAAIAAASATACSSGGSSGGPPPPPCSGAPAVPAGQAFTVSGDVTYDFVPAKYSPLGSTGTLDFGAAEQRPVREAVVQVQQCGTVLQTGATDTAGHYSVTFTPGATGPVAVYVLAKVVSPPITVRDNTADATWAVAQPITSASTLNVHATHGWLGTHYGSGRIAAPFAILDSMYTASRRLLDLPRAVPFDGVPLTVNWSPSNSPSTIQTSYYDPSIRQIYVLGADGIDTDEFDREVIVHEWGHYFEDNFSRSDSPGGSHGFGDVLDPRLAFGEGYASAFAAILLDQRIYADTYWQGPSSLTAFGWDVETPPAPTDDPSPGIFSELSVIRTMWDLYDASSASEAWDGIGTGAAGATTLGAIYDTLVGPERTTPALTTLASFITGFKGQPGIDPAAVDAVLARCGGDQAAGTCIGPITSSFGDGDAPMRAMYAPVAIPSSLAVTLDSNYYPNEQPQNRYFVFTAQPGTTHVTVRTQSTSDVDLYAAHVGQLLAIAESTSGNETIGFPTVEGETYVVILTGWGGFTNPVPPPGTYTATVSFTSP